MFDGCTNLTTIYAGGGWNTEKVDAESSEHMFRGCTNLMGDKGTTFDANHTDKAYARIDGGQAAPGYFSGAPAYAALSSDGTTLTFYCDMLRSTRGTTYDLNEPENDPDWYNDGSFEDITTVVFDPSFAGARPVATSSWFYEMEDLTTITGMEYLNTSEVTDMSSMFNDCCTLTSLDVSHFDTQNVTNMSYMFNGCGELTSLDVSGFDTHNVTDMSYMFGVGSVTTLDVSGFDTRKVTNMRYMFGGCANVTTLDVSGFDTRNVTNMSNMFNSCEALTNLDVSGFNTAKVTTMSGMFYDCYNLKSLDVTHFNTAKVTSMSSMFHACKKLTSLDLSSFNTAQVTTMLYMFRLCTDLKTIYVGDGWTTAAVTSSNYMFENCTSLVGGKGTAWNSSNPMDKTYAHIDGGTSNPGYFTEKSAFILGDVNGDGMVNIADVTALITKVLRGNTSVSDCPAGDLNGDGTLNIADVTSLITKVLRGT
jgi:surface protein